ncbi:hypothetical protein BTIS_1581 [Bifidobacterium tissieri]|uniref:Sugar-binding protein n=1 Tax=Bifidobacterium tissieri TaxID=1630162 RepID=A0A261FDF4_9BIFI|nr:MULTISPECIES: hypothetical protein [Bifidobacterium]OZG57174.1 hypothetical protein BTIS_1581 [Bifidobacterium tissieri]TPF96782.1 hypothetical protein EP30_06315 [Bifidobacterium sp. UTCIF-39]
MAEEYNWPIDNIRAAAGAKNDSTGNGGFTLFSFPPTTSTGRMPLLDPSALAARSGNVLPSDPARRLTIILTSVVVVVAAAACGGFVFLQNKDATQAAFDSCQQSVSIYQQSTDRLKKTVESVQPATQVTADAVADPATLDNLQKAISDTQNVPQITNDCNPSAGIGQNKSVDDNITKQTRDLGTKNENVLDASNAVLKSKDAKEAQAARQDLTNQLKDVQLFFSSAAASKADPAARTQLADVINQAQQLVSTNQIMSTTVYKNAAGALQSAVDNVNKSSLG